MRVGIGAALIIAIGGVVAAIVTGCFGLLNNKTATEKNITTINAGTIQNPGIIGNGNSQSVSTTTYNIVVTNFIQNFYSSDSNALSSTGANNAQKNGTIPGTKYSYNYIEELFPFGYAIIFPTEKKRYRYEVFDTGKLEWQVDLDKMKIDPDFSNGQVEFYVPVSAKDKFTTIKDCGFGSTMPLKVGRWYDSSWGFGNQPRPYFAVLSDSQRNPVFAVGFRIRPPRK